uniref:lytic cellulose monooxygenase (C4-dehydrogenating) n=1 Tax=Heterobasidion parviporum TaxID=207832 RepID=I7DL47_9AGAM|nr:glycoside hydrolase family 61 protein J [Heterobasidion parviporum]
MHPLSIAPALLALAAYLPRAAAHGYLASITIDGTTYKGNVPAGNTDPSPIRQVDTNSPVKGADNPFLNCGQNAQLASQVANANPGSKIDFLWSDIGSNWPHNTGPVMTYMAKCDGTCDKYNSTDAQWFKVDQLGMKPDGSTWYQQDIMNGQPVSVTLSNDIAPGQYLIRHEIIALHLAVSPGGAEFYPSCTQVNIGGSQSGQPNQTVTFPGGYTDTEAGILVPDVFNPGLVYSFPGPAMSNLAAIADTATGQGQAPSSAADSPAPASTSAKGQSATSTSAAATGYPTSSPSNSSPSKQCNLKKRAAGSATKRDVASRPKHLSRIMRDLIHHS